MGRRSSFPWRVLGDRSAQAALLLLALLFVGLVTYLPHMDVLEGRVNPTGAVEGRSEADPWLRLTTAYWELSQGERDDYPYPLHVDENVHWVRSAAIQREETLRFDEPYTGSSRTDIPMSLKGLIHESGFWVAFAQIQDMTGIPWLQLIRFAPVFFAMTTAGLIWAALRPSPVAPLAAAFVALVPTSARFLGIGFFVPIGIGLAWVAAALLLSRSAYRSPRIFIFVMLLGTWAFFIHLIAGFAFILVVIAAAAASLRENRARTLLLGLGVALPFVAFYDAFQSGFQTESEKLATLPFDFTVFDQLGLPFLSLWVLGTGMALLYPPGGKLRVPVISATLVSLAALSFIVVNLAFGLRLYALYDRWHPIFALMGTVPVAWAIYKLWWVVREVATAILRVAARMQERPIAWRRTSFALSAVGLILVSGAFVAAAAPGLRSHLDEPYYRVLDDETWKAFQYAAANTGSEHQVFLAHPWQAPVFNALTGKYPHTWLNPGSPPIRGADFGAYQNGMYADGVWIVERDITLIIDPRAPTDPHFSTVAPRVHILDPALARELNAAR